MERYVRLFSRVLAVVLLTVVISPDGHWLRRVPPAMAGASVPVRDHHVQEATQTYGYDFEQGTTDWNLDTRVWSWVVYGSGHALRGEGHGFVRLTAHQGDVSRLAFRFLLQDIKSSFHANVLDNIETGGERYLVRFENGGVHISRQTGGTFQDFGQGFVPIMPGVWHTAEILIGGGSVDVFVDGEPAVGVDDPTPPPGGYVSFESLDNAVIYIDDVEVVFGTETSPHARAPRPPLTLPPGPDVGPFVSGVYTGTITLTGTTTLTLSQGRYTVKAGNIELRDSAVLRIEPDAVLVFDRGSSPLIHWGVDLKDSASLIVEGGSIIAPPGALVRIHAFGQSTISILDSRPWIHFINAGGDARIEIVNSRFVTGIGGSVQLSDRATLEATNSQLGGFAIQVPAGGALQAKNLRPQTYAHFDLQNDLNTTGISYNLVLSNTTIVTDTLGEGPFERGWIVSVDETSTLDLGNSFLHKLVINLPAGGDDLVFDDLVLGQPTDFVLENISLADTTVVGQWGFFIHGRQVEFNACQGLWLFLFDGASVSLNDSTMNEFDPRNYTGTLTFWNSVWEMSGEIIENNAFTIEGTVRMDDPDLRQSLSWSQSVVTRTYPIYVRSARDGGPAKGTTVTLTRGSQVTTTVTDIAGWAYVSLRFADTDYKSPWQLVTGEGWAPIEVDFFTDTPIIVGHYRVFLPVVQR
ncbi:MAG: hypothetical protein D6759_07935 [Chloroflexi bacterium]|nr:MAG: hypothetical protein D6759_07935 [Chloroflexota bacterium]